MGRDQGSRTKKFGAIGGHEMKNATRVEAPRRLRMLGVSLLAISLFTLSVRIGAQNLTLSLAVSKTTGVVVGDELDVSITVRNGGPGNADDVLIEAGQAQLESYLYYLIDTDTPDCGEVRQLDINPPVYS